MQFSVLISISSETRADDLSRCLQSLLDQTLVSSQIVLVQDGPIKKDVQQCINSYRKSLPIHEFLCPKNRGLGPALRDGLLQCTCDIVARADSDDWSTPVRFSTQTNFLKNNPSISVVGGWMKEYYQDSGTPTGVLRKTPTNSTAAARIATRRNPLNHPTVMFRKSDVLNSGNYESCLLFEDYLLWAKMLQLRYKITSIPQVLVETEIDSTYFSRRGGIKYLKNELNLLVRLREIGFLSIFESGIFLLCRLPLRLLPISTRRLIYRIFLRES